MVRHEESRRVGNPGRLRSCATTASTTPDGTARREGHDPALADFLDAGIVWTGSALPSRTAVMAPLRSRITSNELVVGGGRRDVST